MNIDIALELVKGELERATLMHGSFNSMHEGSSVIREEYEEMWEEIKQNNRSFATNECIQLAAMCIRFLIDLG